MYELSTDEKPSEGVVMAVARVTNQSPLEMEPLIEIIDPDALNTLLASTGGSDPSVTVSFGYCGCQVTATATEIQIDYQD